MKEITSYTSIFRDITQGNYPYVEKKTEHIWNPVKSYKEICFMVRSERFGKSLKVSTLEAVFHGKNDLSNGLAIDVKSYARDRHPVGGMTFFSYNSGLF